MSETQTVVHITGGQPSATDSSLSTQSLTSQSPQMTTAIDSTQSPLRQTTQMSVCIGQQVTQAMTPIDVSSTDQNQSCLVESCSSSTSGTVNVASLSGAIISQTHSQPQNSSTDQQNSHSLSSPSISSAMPTISTSMSTPLTSVVVSPVVSSHVSQNTVNAMHTMNTTLNTMTQSIGSNGQTVHFQQQSPQQTPMIQTSVQHQHQQQHHQQQHHQQHQQTQPNATLTHPMSVAMSHLPQVQVIQQPIGTAPGTYQFQQVYPQQMLLPGNLTIQNMPFGTTNQGLSLQLPFTATQAVTACSMPITSIASKPPIVSKGVAISPITHGTTQHMISSIKPNLTTGGNQIIKQVLPTQQFVPHSSNQTVVISQLLPHQTQHQMHQSILPATNRTVLDANRGKPFGMGSIRPFNKMLSHSGTIQPKSSHILPASSSISSSFIQNSHFKTPFQTNSNTTQLIATPTNAAGILTNQPQILGSFQALPQGLTWTTTPHSAHLVSQNGSPIFIRTPGQAGEHMFIQTSSPQIQTVSMATPINVGSTGTTMQVPHTQSATLSATPMAQPLQQSIAVMNNQNTTTTTMANSATQPTLIAPAPITTSSKARVVRQSTNAATQTNTSGIAQQKQHSDSSTQPKPIAPAKVKTNQINQSTNKVSGKEHVNTARATSAATTQTVSQQTQVQTTKPEIVNQVNKVSVGTETPKISNQNMSNRNNVGEQNKHSNSKSSNTSTNSCATTTTEVAVNVSKVNSNEETAKIAKKVVEKKDASTGQDSDILSNYYAQQQQQHNHQMVQTTVQSCSISTQQNGQIAVLTDVNRQDISKQPPQKAIVKPQVTQILTHVIDGYVIQESPNPFPVNGLSYSDPKSLNDDKSVTCVESVKSLKNKNENSVANACSSRVIRSSNDSQGCLTCGTKRKSNKSNKKSKRFCNSTCAEKYKNNNDKNSCSNRLGLFNSVTSHLEISVQPRVQDFTNDTPITDNEKNINEEKKRIKSSKKGAEHTNDWNSTKNGEVNSVTSQRKPTATSEIIDNKNPLVNSEVQISKPIEEANAASSVAGIFIPPGGKNPLKWSVQDVYEFVRNLQGCTEYADEFRSQEIDGQALMLLKEDHLMSAMNMKLGPALKICNKINALREDVQKQN